MTKEKEWDRWMVSEEEGMGSLILSPSLPSLSSVGTLRLSITYHLLTEEMVPTDPIPYPSSRVLASVGERDKQEERMGKGPGGGCW